MHDFEPEGLICPECGSDYVPGITECSDCHVALIEQTLGAEDVRPDDGDIEAATTTEALVARGWRDVMTAAGVTHRIVVSSDHDQEKPTTYTLIVAEEDVEWATALAGVVEEQPSVDPAAAMQQVRAEFTAAPDHAPDPDEDLFDVPDLIPPPEVMAVVGAARTKMSVFLFLAFLLAAAGVLISPWWGLAAAVAVAEAVRSRRVAQARLAEWERDNDARYPHEAKTSG